jgi:hypothetical protein
MKTALTKIEEVLEKNIKYINKDDDQSDRYYQAGMMFALNLVREEKKTEKQQIIDAQNYSQRGVDGEIYYNMVYGDTTNKETLK